MYETWLVFNSVAECRVDGVAHPGRHGAVHFQIGRGDGVAFLVVGEDDLADALAEIFEVGRDGKDGHQFAADGDTELGVHFKAVLVAFTETHADLAETLAQKVDDPAHFNALGIDVDAVSNHAVASCSSE